MNSAPRGSRNTPSRTVSSTRTPSRSLSAPSASAVPREHHTLSCSLKELYTGCLRVLHHTRTTVHPDGTTISSSHRFKVRVLPGWTHGTTVTFHNTGSVRHLGHPAADVVYTVEERPDRTFRREGNDLVMRKKIKLVEALTGYRFQVETLDGRTVSVGLDRVIPPGFEMRIEREGMPVAGGPPGTKGRLGVKFEVEFPKELTGEQKEGLTRLFDGSATVTTGEN